MAVPKHRRNTTIAAAILYFLTIPFLILVLIGNTSNNSALNGIYFFKLDVSHIIPISVENSQLLNSVARSLGLHDYYQVGLWNFCEGYLDEGITSCSRPQTLYWFNPVEVLVNELLAGAEIALPSQVITILRLLKIGSQVMFGFFITGICVNFVLIFLTPLATRSRWWSLPLAIFAFIGALLVVVATIIGTVISVVFKVAVTAQSELNIESEIGVEMFVFMWIAAVCTLVAFFLHAGMGCCCGVHGGRSSSKSTPRASSDDKRRTIPLPSFVRRRKVGSSRASGTSETTAGFNSYSAPMSEVSRT